jgi:5-methylcytosine-specific restriction endonuclease McrA
MAVTQRICVFCSKPLPVNSNVRRRYCNDTCKAANCTAAARLDGRFEQWAKSTADRNRRPVLTLKCVVCGMPMLTKHAGRRYCSNRCGAKASYERRRGTAEFWAAHSEHTRRRRARKKTAVVEKFTSVEIFVRDGYRCHICRKKCTATAVVPAPLAPTIDHLIPLACGGEHTRANVATACFHCNSVKGDRGGGEQLAVI